MNIKVAAFSVSEKSNYTITNFEVNSKLATRPRARTYSAVSCEAAPAYFILLAKARWLSGRECWTSTVARFYSEVNDKLATHPQSTHLRCSVLRGRAGVFYTAC